MTRVLSCVLLVVWAAVAALPAAAQQNVPNALQGFSRNRDKPVKIEAASLEVRERDKAAVFAGNVMVQQGDTTLRSKQLVVHYDTEAKPAAGRAAAETVAPRQIRKLEATGGVIVTTKEQTATGDLGLFEMAKNTVTLSGNVVLSQGQNVLRGDRLVVDLSSGVSRIEAGKGGTGRVQGLFVPSEARPEARPEAARPAPRPPAVRGN